jgi:RNA polymerase sigma factor (sigma-70 family)
VTCVVESDTAGAERASRAAESAETVSGLVRAAADGDADAWSRLVARYARLVWSVARGFRLDSAEAADVSQTVWLRLVENLSSLRDPERLAGWLVTTTRRECLRSLKSAGREIADDEAVNAAPAGEVPSPEMMVLQNEEQRQLWTAVTTLNERCQRLLRLLAYNPDLSYADVSATLAVPIGSIGPTRGRCLTALRAALTANGGAQTGFPRPDPPQDSPPQDSPPQDSPHSPPRRRGST